jgi:hypothetical protein
MLETVHYYVYKYVHRDGMLMIIPNIVYKYAHNLIKLMDRTLQINACKCAHKVNLHRIQLECV